MAYQEPLSVKDFAAKIKEKYPDYKDVDDSVLVQKMVEKYPEYKDRVQLSEPVKKKEETGFFGSLLQGQKSTSNTTQSNGDGQDLFQKPKTIDFTSSNRDNLLGNQQKDIQNKIAAGNEKYITEERPLEIQKKAEQLKTAPKPQEIFDAIDFAKNDIINNGGGKGLQNLPTSLESLNVYFDNDANNATDYFKRRNVDIDNRIGELTKTLQYLSQKRVSESPAKDESSIKKPIINQLTGQNIDYNNQDEKSVQQSIQELKDYKRKLAVAQDVIAKKYAAWLVPNGSLTEKGRYYNKLSGDDRLQEINRLQDKGITISDEDKYHTDINGLEVAKQQLEDQYSNLPKDDEYYTKMAELNSLKRGVLNKYPEFKKQQGANLIAQIAAEDPKVKAAALYGSGSLDKSLVDYLSKKYEIDPSNLKGIEYGDIPHETLLGNIAKGVTNAATSVLAGGTRLGGQLIGADEDTLDYLTKKIEGVGANLFGENPYEHIQSSPTLINKDLETITNPRADKYNYNAATIKNAIGSGIGNLLGFIGGTKGAGKLLSLGDDAAMTSYLIGSGYEHNYQKANEVMGKDASEVSKSLYATGMGYLEALAFKFLPKDKVFFNSAETRAAQKELAESLSGMSIKNINKELLESKLTKVIKAATGTAEETAKIGGAMSASEMAKATVNSMLGEEKDQAKYLQEGVENVKNTIRDLPFSMAIPLGIMEIPKGISHSNRFKEVLFDAGENPNLHESNIKSAEEKGILTPEEADKKMEVVNTMANIVKSAPTENPSTGEPLTHSQQVEYVYNRAKEIASLTKKEQIKGDVALAQHYDKQAKELVDERNSILEGTHDEYKAMSDIYDRIRDKGTHNFVLNAGTKSEGVKYLQEQALTTPFSVKKTLKGDIELTTDLIARNSPDEIKAEIKDLKSKQKKADENERKAEINELQRHIDLLESGLEKRKENDSKNIKGVSGEIGIGEEPLKAELDQSTGSPEAGNSGMVQSTPEEEIASEIEHKKIENDILSKEKNLTEDEAGDISSIYSHSQETEKPLSIDEAISFYKENKSTIPQINEEETQTQVPIQKGDERGITSDEPITTEEGVPPTKNIPETVQTQQIKESILKAADNFKSQREKMKAMEEESVKYGEEGKRILDEINSEGNFVGVSHESLSKLAKKIGLEEPERGEWHSPEWYADRGRELLKAGANPDEVNNPNNELHDRISIARAYLEKLVKSADSILKEKGIESDEYKKASDKISQYANQVVKKLGTKAGQAMTAMQGERDLDTDSFSAVKKLTEDVTGKPLTKEQEQKIKELTDKNEELRIRAEDAEARLIQATDEAFNKGVEEGIKKSKSDKAKTIANKLRENAKLHKPDSFSAATPASAIWDAAIEIVAKSIEAGGKIVDAIDEGIKYIKESDWYKSLSDDKKNAAESDFKQFNNDNINSSNLEDLQERFLNKKDNKFTQEEAKAIWDYAKKTYIDNGVSYRDTLSNVANDLGLSWRQISNAVVTPKIKRLSDEAWKKSANYARNQQATKTWVNEQNKSWAGKALRKISGAFRGVSVFGHGGIFIGTHAGMTLFNPTMWKRVIPAFLNGYKFAYGNEGNYERRMEELRNSPNYTLAQRAGLKNNPDRINAEEYQKSQHFISYIVGHKIGDKISSAGEKGFNAIKVLRQDLFDYHYNKLSEAEKADPQSAVSIAKLVNNATGASNLHIPEWVNEATFAGGMEAARWGKLTRNPVEATATAMKAIFTPDKATTAEKVFAKVWARRVGEQLATFTSLLAANAAMQLAINPKNPVNMTNPNDPDYLKFKFGNTTVDPTSGMRGVMMFIYGLGKIPFESQKQLHGDTRMQVAGKNVFSYGRGKLAPLYSTMADFFTQQDYNKNPMPFSSDKPTPGHRKLTWGEYLWEKAPLPVAEAAQVTYQSAIENGADKVTLNHLLNGIVSGVLSGGTGFRVGEYNKEEAKHSPFTDEDKKDPTFKYFLDKGYELPNTQLSSEIVTNEKDRTKKKISDYPKDVQDKYTETHKDILKKELSGIKNRAYVYVKEYTTASGEKKVEVYTEKKDRSTKKMLDQLNDVEMEQVLHIAQSQATSKAKKKVFKK